MNSSVRERIERRAYELYLSRGGQHGDHEQDWNEAEKQVMAEIEQEEKKKVKPAPEKVTIETPVQTKKEEPVEQVEADLDIEKSAKPKKARSTSASTEGAPVKKRVAKKKAE